MRQILETLAGVKSVHRNSREEAARRARAVHRILRTLEVLEAVRRRDPGQGAGTQMEYAKRGGNFVHTTAGGMCAWNVGVPAFASTAVSGYVVKTVAGPAFASTSVERRNA